MQTVFSRQSWKELNVGVKSFCLCSSGVESLVDSARGGRDYSRDYQTTRYIPTRISRLLSASGKYFFFYAINSHCVQTFPAKYFSCRQIGI